ncbi:helix-turn-helix domain-containing protein [Microbacterium rhizosphaerae]|uniref:Helix-turn-helix domain-containing protein n=1 Tax=Microbacterium rhizosphaerae TaxID=1678237 RepID=A0ABZ0SUE7_9MICO|nr:helix-turn-helix domain-containing protein [Microbacterium rhizosphaerae]WPR91006.1 helix-turn-helix domain-containing protein [Microbacterium rhizosphaerae]
MLEAIGLDDEHTAIYRLLLELPSADAAQIAAETGMPVDEVARLLVDLEGLGLAARQASSPERVVASPPSLALRPMLVESERRLTAAHAAFVQLSEIYRQGAALRAAPEVVDVVLGPDAVRQRIAQLQASASERVDVFVKSEVALLEAADNVEEERALGRGVRYRTIVETGVIERPGFLDAARAATAAGEEIRALPEVPTRLFLADGRLALLPMRPEGSNQVGGALLVHPSGLLDLVTAVFEAFWQSARPLFTADEEDAVSERELLSLLVVGLTDAAAAAQLGISVRTVQRRISDLSERAGVSSRFQLGVEAVRRGWL